MLAGDAVRRALEAVDERESVVRAWAHCDPDQAIAVARRVDESLQPGPLAGLVLGVKDVFDTADMPTAYGSAIYQGHVPSWDAAAVAMLRAAGAVCLGKTVTAELALVTPGPTTNPHRSTHTPGGSSSGSAAAVAAGMADIALGTQTAGSTIRPASYCGVFGFKPTYGTVSVAGLKLVAPSLDTVGWFARTVPELDAVRVVLTGRSPYVPLTEPPRLGWLRGDDIDRADPDSRAAIERAARVAVEHGADVIDIELPADIQSLSSKQALVQGYEAARSLTWERTHHPDLLSPPLRELLDWGANVQPAEYDGVRTGTVRARAGLARSFAGVDAVLTVAASGEAPADLNQTGTPRFNRLWTLLGVPAVNVPGLTGATGLPVGVQLVGCDDAAVLACAGWLGERVLPI